MTTSPTNCIETSLKNLCGNVYFVKDVAYKIRNGLGNQGFTVVKTAHVDRLHCLLSSIRDENSNVLDEAFEILEGWK